jgi:hypothetical protein
VNKATLRMLNDAEQKLLRQAEPGRLRHLDEDDLVDLHTRIRRARSKYSKLYRRRAGAQVGKHGTRAMASAAHERTAVKAEVFEDALARVSRYLAQAARRSSDRLRDERLAAARARKGGGRAGKGAAGKGGKGGKGSTGKAKAAKQQRTGASKRAAAQSRAANKRKQAKRAAR